MTYSPSSRNNHDRNTAPVITDDSSKGYTIGTKITDKTTGKEYICTDNTSGAAVWEELATRSYVKEKTGKGGTANFRGTDIARVKIPKDLFTDKPKILVSRGKAKNLTKQGDGSWLFDIKLDASETDDVDWQALPRKTKDDD